MPDLRARVDEPELMDTQEFPADVVVETLEFLIFTNRAFGGQSLILKKLAEWSVGWPRDRAVEILDVGTGAADIPVAIAAWARAAGLRVRVTALELVPGIASLARANAAGLPEVRVVQGDLASLAAAGAEFDYVTASLFLHHVPPTRTVETLRTFDRLARRGVIVGDLLRSRAGYWAVRLLSLALGNAVVRHDGPLSVRRAFRPAELAEAARAAGLHYMEAERRPWFRVRLAGEKRAA